MIKRFLLLGYLVTALLFVQGLRVHLHSYDHHSTSVDHLHAQSVHIGLFDNGDDHPDQVGEIELSKEGLLLKNLLLSLMASVLAPPPDILLLHRRKIRVPKPSERLAHLSPWRDSLQPPVRAPPL